MTKDLRERIRRQFNLFAQDLMGPIKAGKVIDEYADDLLALIQEEMEWVIGRDELPDIPAQNRPNSKPGYSLRAHVINDRLAWQRQRLKQLLAPQTNNERKE